MRSEQRPQHAYVDILYILIRSVPLRFFVEYCIESGQSQNGWFKDLPQNQSGARATIKQLKPKNIIQLNICKR